MAEPTSQRVHLRGADCDLLRTGDGDELIVLLHSAVTDRTSWLEQLRAAPARYTAVAVDLRGHGGAPAPPLETVDVGSFADDILELVTLLGFSRAHLVGHAMGGVVALLAHERRPDRVATLTLANAWAHYGAERAADRVAEMQRRMLERSATERAAAEVAGLLADDTPAAVSAEAARILGAKRQEIVLSSWRSALLADARAALARMTTPLLLLGGEQDPICPPAEHLAPIAKTVPGARMEVLAGSRHLTNLDRPAAFNRALYAFLRQNPARDARAGLPAREHRSIPADTTAHALVRLLSARGVEVLFSNSGTDYVDIIDALARYEGDPEMRLRVITAPHENTAIAMAHGYFLASGRVQAVMGHVNVGSANMTLGIINAARANVPVLVLAGRTPYYDDGVPGCRRNFVQWGQDTFDQASFREFLKWDYELRGNEQLEVVVDRALAIATSDPAGPVYLTLPGEVLARPLPQGATPGAFAYSSRPRQSAVRATRPDPAAIEAAADAILAARSPLVVTAELGRYPRGPAALARLAAQAGLGVIEFGKHNFMNLPTSHPMHLGFDPVPEIRSADLVVSIECHVPWIPVFAKLTRAPQVVQIGVDPLAADVPMHAFPADLALAGDPAATLVALEAEIARRTPRLDLAARRADIERRHRAVFETAEADADADAARPTITKRWLSRCIGKLVDSDVIVFNEYDLDPTLVPRDEPGTWFENSIASGLGWALGAALGAKLALPERTIMATVGDGSYLFNTPLSAHFVAGERRLPILIVIFNDRAWSTIKKSNKGALPNGWAARTGRFPLCDFDLAVDYAKIAEACGGVGLRAQEPKELPGVLAEALRLVRTGDRHVLVDVVCERDG